MDVGGLSVCVYLYHMLTKAGGETLTPWSWSSHVVVSLHVNTEN